ncbi:lasso peptide biosynthesis B2 protein [Actinokineospora auranticolor]|uniref:Coenzyme PQQ synthesis protein D (PqqD) n=1 Tax=Actinokineospora auranticolor TaxID=155976 RepID=A0A2S6H1M6_9PSEU|nr:lasso peptide biosynthesis B2 protein [Actinokineospora auranticolor]PPK71389.1 coenzyme PQQ synthesis protein D (PqqD) [Actinokineospora auranticolor]
MSWFTVPETVHSRDDGNGHLVLLNATTGHWHRLNATGAEFFAHLKAHHDVDAAVTALVDRFPGVPADRIRHDVEALVAELVRFGLVEPTERREAHGVLMALPPVQRPSGLTERLAAVVAFPVALLLLRLPFRLSTTAVSRVKRGRVRETATPAQVVAWLAAARWVSRHYPGRVACLELSLTAVLIGAVLQRGVDWCFGFAVDPQTFHAWVEVSGEPVVEAADDPVAATYHRVFLV